MSEVNLLNASINQTPRSKYCRKAARTLSIKPGTFRSGTCPARLCITRWSTNLASNVNLHHAISLRARYGANLVTLRSKFRANETLGLH